MLKTYLRPSPRQSLSSVLQPVFTYPGAFEVLIYIYISFNRPKLPAGSQACVNDR